LQKGLIANDFDTGVTKLLQPQSNRQTAAFSFATNRDL
jgi:hypothetical protein